MKHRWGAERLRVAHVVHSMVVGGAERVICDLLGALDAAQVQPWIICLDSPGPLANELQRSGYPLFCLYRRPGLDFRLIVRLADLFQRQRIDVIHAHQYTPWFYSVLAAQLARVSRVVFTEHGRFYPDERKPKRVFANQWLQHITSDIVAISEATRQSLIKIEGFSARRVRLIYNGIDWELYARQLRTEEARRSLGIEDPQTLVVGTVARFDSIKNLPLLIRAFESLRHPSARLVLVGDGPEREGIETLIDGLGARSTVMLTGIRRDIPQLLPCFDIFVLPSLSEGTSITLLEAMASRLPVIVTSVGGNPEIVIHQSTGYLVPSDDVNALANRLQLLLESPDERVRLGEAGQQRVKQLFSLPQMARQYESLYGLGKR